MKILAVFVACAMLFVGADRAKAQCAASASASCYSAASFSAPVALFAAPQYVFPSVEVQTFSFQFSAPVVYQAPPIVLQQAPPIVYRKPPVVVQRRDERIVVADQFRVRERERDFNRQIGLLNVNRRVGDNDRGVDNRQFGLLNINRNVRR